MISPSDWHFIGLKRADKPMSAANPAPTSSVAQPFRDMSELFPRRGVDAMETGRALRGYLLIR